MIIRALDAAANAALRSLFAPACAACDGPLDRPVAGPVCGACWRAIARLTPPLCARCGDALASVRAGGLLCARCRAHPPLVDVARSAGLYAGALREIIHAFKFDGRRILARPLAAMMRNAGADVLASADAVIPVPLHPWRGWRRGFNQADDLARRLGPPVWRALRRARAGPAQSHLPASARHANVRDAFALGIVTRLSGSLRGRSVVLVDDVMTTGATLDACARVLADAGVRRVSALTAARAAAIRPAPGPPGLRPSTARRR